MSAFNQSFVVFGHEASYLIPGGCASGVLVSFQLSPLRTMHSQHIFSIL